MGTMRPGTRVAMLFAFVGALVLVGSGVSPARAGSGAATKGVIRWYDGLASETAAAPIQITGDSAAPAEHVGDEVTFTARPAGGSAARPLFPNGQSEIKVALEGLPCDGNADPATRQSELRKCYAATSLRSATAGKVEVRAQAASGANWRIEMSFVEPRLIVPLKPLDRPINGQFRVQNVGAAAADIVIAAFDEEGKAIPDAIASYAGVPAGAVVGPNDDRFRAAGFANGTLVAGSQQPLAATKFDGVARADGEAGLTMANGFSLRPLAASTVTLPYVANRLGELYDTSFTVVNTGRGTACVTVRYAFVAGAGVVPATGWPAVVDAGTPTASCARGYAIAPLGSLRFSSSGDSGAVALPPSTQGAMMAATVESKGSGVAVLVDAGTLSGPAKGAAYEGFLAGTTGDPAPPKDVGTSLVAPLALKTADGYYSQVLVSNPNPAAAVVTITYRSAAGETYPVRLDVPADGVANHSVYADSVVPDGFVGSATIASTQPIAAVVFRAKRIDPAVDADEATYTAVNAMPVERASLAVAVPYISRRASAQGSSLGFNSWVSITAPGGGTAGVSILASGSCGSERIVTVTEVTFQGSTVLYQNADSGNGFGTTPKCFSGSMLLTSNVPILAVAARIWDGDIAEDNEGMYNGWPLP
ncbi:MAG: hypothetical protein U0547_14825 [Dehalococcoidia bacterium]